MNNKYSKKQIIEAISYWKSKLKALDEDLDAEKTDEEYEAIKKNFEDNLSDLVSSALQQYCKNNRYSVAGDIDCFDDFILNEIDLDDIVYGEEIETDEDLIAYLVNHIPSFEDLYAEKNPDEFTEDGEYDVEAAGQRMHDDWIADQADDRDDW